MVTYRNRKGYYGGNGNVRSVSSSSAATMEERDQPPPQSPPAKVLEQIAEQEARLVVEPEVGGLL
jgi:hypothetical protein